MQFTITQIKPLETFHVKKINVMPPMSKGYQPEEHEGQDHSKLFTYLGQLVGIQYNRRSQRGIIAKRYLENRREVRI